MGLHRERQRAAGDADVPCELALFLRRVHLLRRRATIYSRKSFDPEHCLRTLAEGGATFTSLVPTHYIMMLGLPAAARARYNVDAVTKLMISSAPARRDTKLAIMEIFRNSGLFELYGSTEAGWVTMLHPEEQFTKLGSVGRECVGSAPIRLLDEDGNEVPDGEPGELYSCNPYTFDGYWKLPEKTERGVPRRILHGRRHRPPRRGRLHLSRRPQEQHDHFRRRERLSVRGGGDARRPSEGEGRRGDRRARREMGRAGARGDRAARRRNRHARPRLLDWCRDRIAGYKRPRSVSFIARRGDAAHGDRQDPCIACCDRRDRRRTPPPDAAQGGHAMSERTARPERRRQPARPGSRAS